MVMEPRHAHLTEIIDCRTQTDHLGNRRRAGFKFIGQGIPLTAGKFNFPDHVTAPHEGRHRFEQFALAIEHAQPRWPTHFVAAKGHKVHIQCLHIDRQVWHTLRAVKHYFGADGMGSMNQLDHRIDRADHVAHMVKAEELGALSQQLVELGQIK